MLRVPAFKDRQNARILDNRLDAQGIAIAGIMSSKIIERKEGKLVRMNDASFLVFFPGLRFVFLGLKSALSGFKFAQSNHKFILFSYLKFVFFSFSSEACFFQI